MQDISHFVVSMPSVMMYVGAQGHLCCSALELKRWNTLLVVVVEYIAEEVHMNEGEMALSQRTTDLEGELKALPYIYVQVAGIYQNDSLVKHLKHMMVCYCVHCLERSTTWLDAGSCSLCWCSVCIKRAP